MGRQNAALATRMGEGLMLEVNLLGTGGMVPLPERYLTALAVRYDGDMILIDCGEGTQMAMRAQGLPLGRVSVICVTHFHADHIAGLPGLLLTIGNAERTEPLTIIGPKYIGKIADSLRVIAPQLPYEVRYIEIGDGRGGSRVRPQQGQRQALPLHRLGSLEISAREVEHRIPCYAYKLNLSRRGKFNAEAAKEQGIPVRYWSVLQRGEAIELDGKTILPEGFTGPPRRGLRICYATDLRPGNALVDFVREADLFVCEGMYGDPESLEKALKRSHCMMSEAADMAKRADVRELWLTHFSPSMPKPEEWAHIAKDIFPNSHVDKKHAVLRFDS
jgi:ribonuclease Z